jgi:hypothetical protein
MDDYGCIWDIRVTMPSFFRKKQQQKVCNQCLFASTGDLIEKSFRDRRVTWFSQGLWIDINLTQDLCMFRSVKGIPAGGHPEVFRKG